MKAIGGKFMRTFMKNDGQTSYSQCREDLIDRFIFSKINLSKPFYLDIGAHHPNYLSNTYFLKTHG